METGGMIDRSADTAPVRAPRKRSRVAALLGPRQCGKTTLAELAGGEERSRRVGPAAPTVGLRHHDLEGRPRRRGGG